MTVPTAQPLTGTEALGAVVPGDTEAWTPMRPLSDTRRDLTVALDALALRRPLLDKRWDYYEGRHDSLWVTAKLREVFGPHFSTKLEDNWCELAVEALVLRLGVTGWQLRVPLADDATDEEKAAADSTVAQVETLVRANRLDLEQEELYRKAGAEGEHYVMAWPRYADPDGEDDTQAVAEDGTPLYDITTQDARNVYVHASNDPGRRWCAKVWRDTREKRWRATLYYAGSDGEVIRLRTAVNSNGSEPPKADRYELDPGDPGGDNPLAPHLPLFRFAQRRNGRSRLDSLRPIQDKINKLAVGKMVAAEFVALKQRYALLGEDIPDNVLKAVPGSVWKLPAGSAPTADDPGAAVTRVGEFSEADLSQFDNAKDAEVQTFLTIGMLPRNLRVKDGASSASGEAITKDSGPFVGLVEDHQAMYGGAWADLWEALGYDVVPVWAPAEFSNSKAVAEEVKLYVDAGVPVELALRWAGRGEDDLEELRRLQDEDAGRRAAAGAAALGALDQGTGALEALNRAASPLPAVTPPA